MHAGSLLGPRWLLDAPGHASTWFLDPGAGRPSGQTTDTVEEVGCLPLATSVRLQSGTGKGTTEDEMVGWHHRLNRHEFEESPGVSDRQGGLVCCRPWAHKGLDTTEQLN